MKKNQHFITFYTIIISFSYVVISALINLVITPRVTNTIGIEAYGFVTLVRQFVSYGNIIMISLNAFSARYMTIAYTKGNIKQYNKYFNTIFWGNVIFAGILFIIGLCFTYFSEKLLVIPKGLEFDVKILFVLTFFTFFVNSLATAFTSNGHVLNRIDSISLSKSVAYIFEAILLIIGFFVLYPRVWYVGIASAVAAIIIVANAIVLSIRNVKGLQIQLSLFRLSFVKELLVSGIWNSLNNLGNALNTGLDLLISNLFLSPLRMGQLSIAKTLSSMVYAIYSVVSTPFQPQLLKYYSTNDKVNLISEFRYSMGVCGIVTNTIFIGFVALGKSFFSLWVPTQDIELLYKLTLIAFIPSISEGTIYPLYYTYTLTLKNKFPCVVTIIGGIVNVVAMLILLKKTFLGVYAVLITTAVIMSVINLITNPIYICKCLNIRAKEIYVTLLKSIVACLMLSIVAIGLRGYIFECTDWFAFVIKVLGVGIASIIIQVPIVGLKKKKRLTN